MLLLLWYQHDYNQYILEIQVKASAPPLLLVGLCFIRLLVIIWSLDYTPYLLSFGLVKREIIDDLEIMERQRNRLVAEVRTDHAEI